MIYTTVRCPEHPGYNPCNLKSRNTFNHNCNTCTRLFYATEPIGAFPGELWENGEGANNAKYRIGPLTLEQFGKVRFTLGFYKNYDDEMPNFWVDVINRTIYTDDIVPYSLTKNFLELGCVIYERVWPKPPRMTVRHFLYAIREGFQEFWDTLTYPPKGPFIETAVKDE
jgi:hypothetical protein